MTLSEFLNAISVVIVTAWAMTLLFNIIFGKADTVVGLMGLLCGAALAQWAHSMGNL